MFKQYIKKNIILISILLFISIFGSIQLIKPSCFYKQDGSIRQFGVGYKNKTIFPIWVFALTLGILCYLSVIYFCAFS
jgi:hypothetical protein